MASMWELDQVWLRLSGVVPARKPARPEPRLPAGLAGPVDLALARAVDAIPGPNALVGGSRYEPKYDGYLYWTCQTR